MSSYGEYAIIRYISDKDRNNVVSSIIHSDISLLKTLDFYDLNDFQFSYEIKSPWYLHDDAEKENLYLFYKIEKITNTIRLVEESNKKTDKEVKLINLAIEWDNFWNDI